MKIVEVEWFDAQTSTTSMFIEDARELKPLHSHSVGYLIDDNPKRDYIILSFLNFGEDLTKHHQVIPRGMIKKIKVIRR